VGACSQKEEKEKEFYLPIGKFFAFDQSKKTFLEEGGKRKG